MAVYKLDTNKCYQQLIKSVVISNLDCLLGLTKNQASNYL